METPAERKIDVLEPFFGGIELTKRILFQPFDFAKWLTIAFAAFLAGLADGTRGGFNPNLPGDFGGDHRFWSSGESPFPAGTDWTIFIVIMAVVAVVVIALTVLFMWVGSRGRFLFIDCIVRNRGAIQEPWREYRPEGNSLFLFMLVTLVGWLVLMMLAALPVFLPFFTTGEFSFGAWQMLYTLTMVAVLGVLWIFWALIVWCMPAVMYRQRCGALAALRHVTNLIVEYPLPFILFLVMAVALVIGGLLVSCVVTCVTCCIAAIPYVGTVVLLPLYVFYYAFTLLFLRQFGPEYDAWANVPALEEAGAGSVSPEAEAPPVQKDPVVDGTGETTMPVEEDPTGEPGAEGEVPRPPDEPPPLPPRGY